MGNFYPSIAGHILRTGPRPVLMLEGESRSKAKGARFRAYSVTARRDYKLVCWVASIYAGSRPHRDSYRPNNNGCDASDLARVRSRQHHCRTPPTSQRSGGPELL